MTSDAQVLLERVDQPPGPLLIPHTRPHVIPPLAPADDPLAAVDNHGLASAPEEWHVDDQHVLQDVNKQGLDDRSSHPLTRSPLVPSFIERLPCNGRHVHHQFDTKHQ